MVNPRRKENFFIVIPAEAGIQEIEILLDSCFRRSDDFPEFLQNDEKWNLGKKGLRLNEPRS
jgi:hypothetical protein